MRHRTPHLHGVGLPSLRPPALRNGRQNSDDANARIEHDKVLVRIVTGMVKDDAELFKQFMENEDFKRRMAAKVFEPIRRAS